MCHLSALRNWKTEHFSTPRLNSWNGKFLVGSLYEFTSSQKLSVGSVGGGGGVVPILGRKTPVLPGIKYLMEGIVDTDILSQGVPCMNSGNWNELS